MNSIKKKDNLSQLIAEGEHIHQDFKYEISDIHKIAKSISAFANTEGGQLLIGVKDNGKVVGVKSEEEIYMINAAAQHYCTPPVDCEMEIVRAEGKNVVIAKIPAHKQRPIYAIDTSKKHWAYLRIEDETVLASPVHLYAWKQAQSSKGSYIEFSTTEKKLLSQLKQRSLSLNAICKKTKLNRKTILEILGSFFNMGVINIEFKQHTFYFKIDD
jgi:predicted HTH transcriptional regulator